MTTRTLTSLALATALAACSGQVDPLPAGGQVTCATTADCPSGSVCSAAIQRCVPDSATDRLAPTLKGAVLVDPPVASAGTLITVSFEVSEELASPPELRFQGATDTLGTPSRHGLTYTLVFPAPHTDTPEQRQLVARLVDVYGNVAATVPVGQVTLDSTRPAAAPPTVTPDWARVGSTLSVVVTFDEPVRDAATTSPPGPPALALGPSGPRLQATPGPGSNTWTFTRTLDGTEPEGLVDLVLAAADLAGNPVKSFTATAAIDFTVPTVQSATIHTPAVRAGDTFVASVRFSEPLQGPPSVALIPVAGGAPIPVVASAIDATSYALSLEIPAGTPDGDMQLTLQAATDRAGNPAGAQALGPARLDSTAPGVLSFTPDHVGRLYRASQAVQVTFETTEPLAGPPQVRLELQPLPLEFGCTAVKATAWSCLSPALTGAERPESVVTVSVTATDTAGNVATSGTSVILDFTPPSLISAAPGRSAFPAGGQVTYLVNTSEPLGAAPALTVRLAGTVVPGFFGPPASANATTFSWSRAVPTAGDGAYTVEVALIDEAGNARPASAGTGFSVDTAAPAVVGTLDLVPAKAAYMAGDRPAVTFTVSEDIPAPAARLGTTAPIGATCVAGGTARTFTCTLDRPLVATDLPQGANAILVTLADAAGNVGYGSKAVVLDYAPPTLAGAPGTQLIPGAGNLRSTITAVGAGSTFRLTLTSAEPLQAPPAVQAVWIATGTGRSLSLVSQSGTTYVYDFSTGGAPYLESSWVVTWDPIDLAGNRYPAGGLPVVASIPVDGTAPAAPSLGTAGAPLVLWRRSPWGSDTSTSPDFRVVGLPASVAAADLLVAWDGPQPDGREVARGAIGATGFDVTLPGDPAELWVSAVDGAGNEGARARVVDVTWTASLGDKVPGSTFENPNRLVRRAFSAGSLSQSDDVEVAGPALGLAGDGLVVTTSSSSAYRPVSGTASPAARRYYGLAQDAGRGVLVLYGGQLAGGAYPGDTWEWDGTGWKQIVPTDPEGDGNPAVNGYWGTPMAYDPVRGTTLLLADNLWAWNGSSWRALDAGLYPRPGYHQAGAMAWDARRGVMVVFGGGYANDTWEWDGTSWLEAVPANTPGSPAPRSYHKLAWDPVRQRILLYGGMQASVLNDLWAWDGASWTQLTFSGTTGGRSDHAMAYDPVRSELVVQGGYNAASVLDGKTWVLRQVGATPTWVDVTPSTGPLPLSAHQLVYEQRTNRLQLFGDLTLNQLRQWNGSSSPLWTVVSPGNSEGDGNPVYTSSGSAHSLAYNGARGVTVFQDTNLRQTWEWNRASWGRKVNGAGPTQRSSASIGSWGASTILHGGSIFGSSVGDTWRWDGTTWTQLIASPVRAGPPFSNQANLRQNAALVTDPSTGTLYRFGGADQYSGGIRCYPDLYRWDNVTPAWVLVHSETWPNPGVDSPPPYGVGVAGSSNPVACGPDGRATIDPTRGSLVLFDPSRMEAWELKLATLTWTHHAITGYPYVSSSGSSVFFDGSLNVPVALDATGGFAIDLAANAYRFMPAANPYGMTLPTGGRAVFDDVLAKAVGLEMIPYTWESGTSAPPAHLFTVDYSRANGPDPGLCVDPVACPIQQIDVRWTGGASSPYASGGILQAWTGEWYNARGTAATPGAPAAITWSWTAASPFPASSLFHGTSRALTFELVPNGPSSAGAASQVATDAVMVTVHYRRP